jgi:predicted O-methyltransferase YrrM
MPFADVIAEVDAECRRRSIPMLGPEKAARLVELIREARPALVVEVGTAIGYSGLWIAQTLQTLGAGRLVTLEQDAKRAAEAGSNFRRSGVDGIITQLVGDARERIGEVAGPVDVLFLDGGFENYYPCFLRCRDKLRPGALLIADNAGIGADQMADYLDLVRRECQSRTEWFETDLSWNPRDAMEISIVPGHASMMNDK